MRDFEMQNKWRHNRNRRLWLLKQTLFYIGIAAVCIAVCGICAITATGAPTTPATIPVQETTAIATTNPPEAKTFVTEPQDAPQTTATPTPIVEVQEVEETPEPTPTAQPVKLYDVPLSTELQHHIIEQAAAHGIDPVIIVAMAFRESNYDAEAIGDGGNSEGLLQIQPRWHRERMERLGCDNLLDPFQNVTVGVDFLAELVEKYDGNVEKALVAYNMGQTGAYKHCFSKGVYSSKYSNAVMEKAEELRGESDVLHG